MTRRALDRLYDAAGYLAAFFMVGILAMVLASVVGRLVGFNLRGSDAYAGYCMAASGFLALAHTLKRGEHIRVTLFLERFGGRLKRPLDIWSHVAGTFFSGALAWFSIRLAWQSHTYNDISQGNDATPLWIPQIAMAVGTIVLAIAMADDLVLLLRRRKLAEAPEELKAIE
ncbi:MAG TPA: TRAP transporter small permease [Usitatibacter sp.]|jgi:TRAP-type C4-dicarboxylate transport system permease small subunit|nr:TRAP transporter small permease [Usitatibacter sp.]